MQASKDELKELNSFYDIVTFDKFKKKVFENWVQDKSLVSINLKNNYLIFCHFSNSYVSRLSNNLNPLSALIQYSINNIIFITKAKLNQGNRFFTYELLYCLDV